MSIIRNLYDAVYHNFIGGGAYLRIMKGCIFTVLIFVLALCIAFYLQQDCPFCGRQSGEVCGDWVADSHFWQRERRFILRYFCGITLFWAACTEADF